MSILKDLGVPVFKAGGIPAIDLRTYVLSVGGLLEKEHRFSLQEILALPKSKVDCRLTSVSGWSVRAPWAGVKWNDFLKQISLPPEANHVRFTTVGEGYTTVVPLKDLENPRVLLAYEVNGEPIELEYGGPLRMVIPNLWGYKSCKWLGRIDFMTHMEGGYWEDRGYTRSGIIEPGSTLDMNTKSRRPISGGEILDF